MNFLFSNPIEFINSVQPPVSTGIIFLAQALGNITIVLALGFLFFHREKNVGDFAVAKNIKDHVRDFFVIAFSTCGAFLAAGFIKNILKIARPFVQHPELNPLVLANGYSFPSEHATTFMALAVALFFLHRKAGIFFLVLAILIGLGRILAGVHTPLDILGGCVLGALFAYTISYISLRLQNSDANI
ncbi:MAG: phosphatase PAP2 family protein [Candidatus Pacebacteria bacterium]|nr:phosphatase PAP2 family protein [Candidatus Paceibacterota bacterium]